MGVCDTAPRRKARSVRRLESVTDVLRRFGMAAARRLALGSCLGVLFLLASFGGSEKAVPMSEGSNIPFHAATARPARSRRRGAPDVQARSQQQGDLRGRRPGNRCRGSGEAGRRRDPRPLPAHRPERLPLVFGVVGTKVGGHCGTTFYRVQLPVAPNGSTGWVAAWAVRVLVVHTRIAISPVRAPARALSQRQGRVSRQGCGGHAPTQPTPTGDYFVNERFVLANPSGPFGVAALGISAHSTVLKNWVQGGPIGIHGTNEPTLIGDAASHGCVRLFNSDMSRLFKLAPAGARRS